MNEVIRSSEGTLGVEKLLIITKKHKQKIRFLNVSVNEILMYICMNFE